LALLVTDSALIRLFTCYSLIVEPMIKDSTQAMRERVAAAGQEHLLGFYDTLNKDSQKKLISQLEDLNLDELITLAEQYVKNKPAISIPEDIKAVNTYPYTPKPDQEELYAKAEARGKELVQAGKVAAFLVAGGQGTRLGYDGPKGEYCVTPIKEKSLFQVFAEQLLAYSRDNKVQIPWYIMTSEANDQVTKEFFKKHNHFGYSPDEIFFFKQGMMPAFSMDGKLLLGSKDSLALSPDGHGGSLRALQRSGALEDMKKRGIEHLSYFQVDNPLVHIIDYRFIGLHDLAGSEMSSKTVAKAGPKEKVGNFVEADGKVQIIEYSDLPEELAVQTNTDGSLKFNAGSIAIHALRVSFIERLTSCGTLNLPWHRAEKKVGYVNASGELIKPETPNAVKLEQFIFDAIPLAQNAIVYETDRAEEFSPVKNAEGSDSPVTCRDHQIARAARWLTEAGIVVPMKDGKVDAVLEIDPLVALSAEQLKTRDLGIKQINSGSRVFIGTTGIEDSSEVQAPELKKETAPVRTPVFRPATA
jgi:UDP-N-acetylglucosamine/UDP-N-acetylgalactosamine diphosphorylase